MNVTKESGDEHSRETILIKSRLSSSLWRGEVERGVVTSPFKFSLDRYKFETPCPDQYSNEKGDTRLRKKI